MPASSNLSQLGLYFVVAGAFFSKQLTETIVELCNAKKQTWILQIRDWNKDQIQWSKPMSFPKHFFGKWKNIFPSFICWFQTSLWLCFYIFWSCFLLEQNYIIVRENINFLKRYFIGFRSRRQWLLCFYIILDEIFNKN